MDEALRIETASLQRSWAQHDPQHLQSYLVRGVEDPRINLQSVFSRHFILRQLLGESAADLMRGEIQFSAVMNWVLVAAREAGDPELLSALLEGLTRGVDNVEGIQLPVFVRTTLHHLDRQDPQRLPFQVPNYLRAVPGSTRFEGSYPVLSARLLDTFCVLWRQRLDLVAGDAGRRFSVLEPACGSANDYRVFHQIGIAQRADYIGFDLCESNIANARQLFPEVRFQTGNVFEISAGDQAFDLCYVHDLFEHLSLRGLEAAISELCRVTRLGLSIGFFNMDEIPDHVQQPHEDYYWNTLSMRQIKASFARRGFACRVWNMAAFLREEVGCPLHHNPNAYTMVFWRSGLDA